MTAPLTHLDAEGRVRMVDVTDKAHTRREAVARAIVALSPESFAACRENSLAKGDLVPVVTLAGIQGAKRAPELIPLAHPLPLTHVAVDVAFEPPGHVVVTCAAKCDHATGVEMEAMCGAAAAALCVYDMVKGIDRSARIEAVELLRKSGGKSGDFRRREPREGRLLSIHASERKGTKKLPLPEATLVADHGIAGDAHAGSERQVSLLPVASADRMRAKGAAVAPGDFAENLLVEGFETTDVAVGDTIAIGPARLEVTRIGKDCHDGCWIKKTVGDCVMPREGFFARVIEGGVVRPGDPLRLLPGK